MGMHRRPAEAPAEEAVRGEAEDAARRQRRLQSKRWWSRGWRRERTSGAVT